MGEYDTELSKIVAELNRAAPSQKTASRGPQSTASLDQLLGFAASRNASDVLLIAGAPAMLRVNGNLAPASGPLLEAEDVRSLLLPLLEPAQMEELREKKSVDLGFVRENLGRFRINIHHQRGTLAASIRLLPARSPSLEWLHLPASLARLAERRQGLVLVTGPTGCGKTSTLAALIDLVNTRRAAHVVTIEDPVEYQHANRSAIIEQIEVGRDTPDFAVTLRSIMRQTPDVILVGEMRDAETMATVLTAAETGHLVLSTLHTIDASKTVERIIGAFPMAEQHAMRSRLAKSFSYIVSQRLIPRKDGSGRIAAIEILKSTLRTREYVEKGEGEGKTLLDAMRSGSTEGMQYFDGEIERLIREGIVSQDVGLAYATNPGNLRLELSDLASAPEDPLLETTSA